MRIVALLALLVPPGYAAWCVRTVLVSPQPATAHAVHAASESQPSFHEQVLDLRRGALAALGGRRPPAP